MTCLGAKNAILSSICNLSLTKLRHFHYLGKSNQWIYKLHGRLKHQTSGTHSALSFAY